MNESQRYDRQIRMFGSDGQQAIAAKRVAIVGLGGLGSHLAQQLAYLGVRMFLLVDRDRVSASNLNRLIGAVPADADSERRKVSVARDMILAIAPGAEVRTVADVFASDEGFEALKTADVVMGAVDNDASRLILNEFCQAYSIPYIDAASDVYVEGSNVEFGGRVVASQDGGGCLHCLDLLDQEAIDVVLADEEARRTREEIYGVPRDALDAAGPSVVSVNGVIASLAVTEFVALVTQIRPPERHLSYRGSLGRVFAGEGPRVERCYYCDELRGEQDRANVERYLRIGVRARLISTWKQGGEGDPDPL